MKISNVSEEDLSGTVLLELFDAITMEPIEGIFHRKSEKQAQSFEVKAQQNSLVSWILEIPSGVGLIAYRVVAQAGTFSDGEEKPIPVLTNRMLVTE